MSKITRKKNHSTRVISVKLPLSLYDDLQAFRRELQAFDSTMILNVNDLVTSALKRDLRVAREELESLKRVTMKPPPTQQSTLTSASPPAAKPPAPPPAPVPAPPVADAPIKTQGDPDGSQGERPREQATSEGQVRPRKVQDFVNSKI